MSRPGCVDIFAGTVDSKIEIDSAFDFAFDFEFDFESDFAFDFACLIAFESIKSLFDFALIAIVALLDSVKLACQSNPIYADMPYQKASVVDMTCLKHSVTNSVSLIVDMAYFEASIVDMSHRKERLTVLESSDTVFDKLLMNSKNSL